MLPDTPRFQSRLDLLYLVTREFNAGLEIDQVLQRVIGATVASVGASDASLSLFNENGSLADFYLIKGFEMEERSVNTISAVHEKGLSGWVKNHREGALIKDTQTDNRWFFDEENHEFSQVGSAVSVPIQLPDQLIGVLTITAKETDFFTEDDLAMLTIIADQAAFAIVNARLFEAEQHRRSLADTLASVARTLNSTLNLNEVLDLILEQLARVVAYDSSSILLYDDESSLKVRAARGFQDRDEALKIILPLVESSPNYHAITHKKPVVLRDVNSEPGWIKTSSNQQVRSWIGVPLIARDEVIGMLTVDSFDINKYSPETAQDVVAFADQAATAVANAQVVTRLKSAEASYAALFEDSSDMIIITDYQGLILNANRKACQMLRLPKDILKDIDIEFISPQLRTYLEEQTSRLKRWREAAIEIEVLDAYKNTLSLELIARQVHYNGRDCVQWVGRDISARKEAEKMRQDLVNMVVHDLRGPVGNLINVIELIPMMLNAESDDTTFDQILNMAKINGQEVKDLLDSMLDVSRLEQGELPLQYSPVTFDTLIYTVQEQVTPRAKAKQMELTFNLASDIPILWIDENIIRRVLINLIDNSIKYTPSEGRISLTSLVKDEHLHIAISDNGPGISKEDQIQVFNKFSRVGDAAKIAAGVGLGLAFCKLAIEAHGGKISVESEGIPGKGSTFSVSLPLYTEPPE